MLWITPRFLWITADEALRFPGLAVDKRLSLVSLPCT